MEMYYEMTLSQCMQHGDVTYMNFAKSIHSICHSFLLFEFLLWMTVVANTKLPALMFSGNYGYMDIFKLTIQAKLSSELWETISCWKSYISQV